ncbi:MAG TPA: hypothetical protein VMB70_13310, partial [Terriglobia bacterium]|nr:hypothetical protein [Terriglobia bacterium]
MHLVTSRLIRTVGQDALSGNLAPCVSVFDQSPAIAPSSPTLVHRFARGLQRAAETVRSWLDKPACLASTNVVQVAVPGKNDRTTACHGFQGGHRESLGIRRKHENVGPTEEFELPPTGYLSEKTHPRRHSMRHGQLFHFPSIAAARIVAGDKKEHIRATGCQSR